VLHTDKQTNKYTLAEIQLRCTTISCLASYLATIGYITRLMWFSFYTLKQTYSIPYKIELGWPTHYTPPLISMRIMGCYIQWTRGSGDLGPRDSNWHALYVLKYIGVSLIAQLVYKLV